jgi:hypothetical protein
LASDRTYTPLQVARAATELRQAAGANEQAFSGEDVVQLLSDEIRLLRERGFTDEHIAELFQGFDIEVDAGDIAHSGGFGNELR